MNAPPDPSPQERATGTSSDAPRPHPGAVLRGRVLTPLGIPVARAARDLGVTRQALHRLLAEDAGVTPAMAARLGRFTGTGGAYWLGLQRDHDLVEAERALGADLGRIPLAHSGLAACLTGKGGEGDAPGTTGREISDGL